MIVNILWVSVWMVFMVILSEAKVVWEVEKPISEYGEDLELNCIAVDYNMSLQSSKRWYQGQTLLTFNDGSEDNTKYNASLISNGYKLIIKNLTKNDVNITYMCSDGFDKSENLPLRIQDVFKGLQSVTVHTGMIRENDSSIAVILGIVFGIATICIVIFVFAILYRRKKLRMLIKICYGESHDSHSGDIQGNEEQIPLPTIQPDIIDNQQPNRDESSVIGNVANRFGHHPSNGDQYDGVGYHPVQPNESNGTNSLGTNIANRFCHHPSNEDIETSGTSQTSDKSFQPVIATSFSRIGACKTPQPQQSDDEDNETSHVADTDGSIVSSQQEEVVISNNDSHILIPNQEEEIIISSAKFPAYSKKRVRVQSFTEWSLSEPSKQKMANAGFFYKGCNTYAQCFCCGFNQKWRENDDPFSSSLHNDNCSYSQKVNNSSAQDSNSSIPNNEETNPKSME